MKFICGMIISIAAFATVIGVAAQTPMTSADYVKSGKEHSNKAEWALALADYDKAIGLDPNNAEVYLWRGEMHSRQHRQSSDPHELDLAFADYSRAIEIDPKNAGAYIFRASLYGKVGKYDLAIADLTKLIEIVPADNNGYEYERRAELYLKLRKYDLAISDLTHVISLHPGSDQAYYLRGLAYAALRKFDLAITDLTRAIEETTKFIEKAKKQNEFVPLDDVEPGLYLDRAKTYCMMGKKTLAKADEDQAVKLGAVVIDPCSR